MKSTLTGLFKTQTALFLAGVCVAAVCMTAPLMAYPKDKDKLVYEKNLEVKLNDGEKDRTRIIGVIRFYSYASGGSGYYQVENKTDQKRKYQLTIKSVVKSTGKKEKKRSPFVPMRNRFRDVPAFHQQDSRRDALLMYW